MPLLLTACSGGAGGISPAAVSGPGADVRALTGTRTRVVWVQGDGTDPLASGTSSS